MKRLPVVLLLVFAALVLACSGAIGIVAWFRGAGRAAPQTVGAVLIYEVAPNPKSAPGPVSFQEVIEAAGKRINPGGAQRARIEQIDGSRIEIARHTDDPETIRRIEWLLQSPGSLEMRVLANRRDNGPLIEEALCCEGDALTDPEGELLARWVPVHRAAEADLAEEGNGLEAVTRTRQQGDRQTLQVLVVQDEVDVDESYLRRAVPSVDRRGRPSLTLHVNMASWQQFRALVEANRPGRSRPAARRLGILVDGRLYSAPAIDRQTSDWVQITGDFTREELADAAAVLNAGPMPATLKPSGEAVAEGGG